MRAQATGPVPLARASGEQRPREEAGLRPDPGWVAMTRHTWRLATRSFELDLTWCRQEGGEVVTSSATPPQAPAAPARQTQPRPLPSFAEVLRRRQLAALVMMPSIPPPDRQPLAKTDQRAPALPGQVCRAYARGQGPLAAPASRCFMA